MAERWLLLETFGGDGHREPTVIGLGISPKRMVPLASVFGRGRSLGLALPWQPTAGPVAAGPAAGGQARPRRPEGRT
jgi:hypothetical protein